MKACIKGVAVFRDAKEDGKRYLELGPGLNIISGHSKTGKSAIMDIIDWCLCAEKSNVPKGVITDFTKIYSLLIELNGQTLLIGRRDEKLGKNYVFVKPVNPELTIRDVVYDDFEATYFIKRDEALKEINRYIDLSLSVNALELGIEGKVPRTDIRDSLCYVLQHQTTLPNSRELFYLKPNPKHFPVLAGWFGPEYYVVLGYVDKLKKNKKALEIKQETALKNNKPLIQNLFNALRRYYGLIGKEFSEDWTVEEVEERVRNLEEFKKEEFNDKILERQEVLEKQMERLGADKLALEQKLQRVCRHKEQGKYYSDFIRKYEQRTQLFGAQRDYVCPICGKENEELSVEALNILQAGDWLKKELCSFPEYKEKFDQEENEIRKRLTALKAELAVYTKEYKENKELIEKIVTQKNLNEIRLKAQWKVMSEYEIYRDRKLDFDEKDLDLQGGELAKAKERLKTYNVGEKYVDEKSRLQDYMNIVIDSLDFEHTPPELRFELNPEKDDCFQLYHNKLNDERIFLPQIGSASNSVACHVGLFLSFLYYFSVEKNSKVPGILFFDQPSQAYFPSGTDNKDLEKVAQIYETILKVLQETEQDAGFLPQVIVADHIRDLGEQNVQLYEHYFRADWRDGRAFI